MNGIMEHVTPRENGMAVRGRVSAVRREFARREKLYKGGTPAEEATLASLRGEAEEAALRERLAHTGRRIDLESLARQRREDGSPLWAVADPREPVGLANGRVEADGTCQVGGNYLYTEGMNYLRFGAPDQFRREVTPAGIVPLPPRVRRLLARPEVREQAHIVGVLFQPEGWLAPRPDPALVVEWRLLRGRYYALAVWGTDRGRIMEWVS